MSTSGGIAGQGPGRRQRQSVSATALLSSGERHQAQSERIQAYCAHRAWAVHLKELPPLGGSTLAALGQLVARARAALPGSARLIITSEALSSLQAHYASSWSAARDLLDHAGVAIITV